MIEVSQRLKTLQESAIPSLLAEALGLEASSGLEDGKLVAALQLFQEIEVNRHFDWWTDTIEDFVRKHYDALDKRLPLTLAFIVNAASVHAPRERVFSFVLEMVVPRSPGSVDRFSHVLCFATTAYNQDAKSRELVDIAMRLDPAFLVRCASIAATLMVRNLNFSYQDGVYDAVSMRLRATNGLASLRGIVNTLDANGLSLHASKVRTKLDFT